MAFQRLDRGVIAELTLMCFAVFAGLTSAFSIIAVLLLAFVGTEGLTQSMHPLSALTLLVMVAIAIWNVASSIKLFETSNPAIAVRIILRSAVAISPVVVIFLLSS